MYWTFEGKVYDFRPAFKWHPGGQEILKDTCGTDITILFNQSHLRLTPNINEYEVKNLSPNQTSLDYKLSSDAIYSEIKLKVKDVFKTSNIKASNKKLSLLYFGLLCTIFTFYQLLQGSKIGLLFPILYWITGVNSFHDASHYALTRNKLHAKFWIHYGSWFISPAFWRRVHNQTHHVYTNILGYDPDIGHNFYTHKTIPTAEYRENFKYQMFYYFFIVITVVFPLRWYDEYLFYWKDDLAPRFKRQFKVDWVEFSISYLYRFTMLYFFIIYPYYHHDLFKAVFFSFYTPMMYSLLFMIFSQVSHLNHQSTQFLEQKNKDLKEIETKDVKDNVGWIDNSWTKHQIKTSSNYSIDSTFWTIMSGGLNYQIEHHLFPTINHEHLDKITPIIKEICVKYKIPYNDLGCFTNIMYEHLSHMYKMSFTN
jgi:fatty acid desaturase